jgi:predicted phage terminase large subunit-like protein
LLAAARESPAALGHLAFRERFAYPPHIELIDEALQAVAWGQTKRLLVTMPPRHGKSYLISQIFPAWYVGRFPTRRLILASYEADFAASWGAKARALLDELGPPVFGVSVAPQSRAAKRWDTTAGGGMTTAGVGGPITGKGAHVLLIDDPVKNSEEAASATIREKTWQWYLSTAYTRLESEPEGAVIVVMTRWHEDDLAGRILAADATQQWRVLRLPAVAEEDDGLGRAEGAALWPARFPRERLDEIRAQVGHYWFSALYQQRPAPLEGMRFQRSWFRYARSVNLSGIDYWEMLQPDGTVRRVEQRACWRFQTVDPAATTGDSSDYFAAGTWDVTPAADVILVDMFRERAETTQHRAIMRMLYDRFSPNFQAVEKVSFGLNIIQECVTDGLPVQALSADRDKLSRSLTMQARYEQGAVYHRQDAPWLGDYEDELVSFPVGRHDDQVDCASYAGIQVAGWGGEVAILTSPRKREAGQLPR